jgi:CheY-like chemotaxis protein/anti-sigma regulatory factor (Ser/Thr protein kinase)
VTQATILVVDDSALDRRLAGALVGKDEGLRAVFASNGREALEAIDRERPQAVVTDLHMPEMDGLQLVEAVRKNHPSLPVILMTAHGSEETAVHALRIGAASYVHKRRLAQELVTIVKDLLDLRAVRRQSEPDLAREKPSRETRSFVIGNDVAEAADIIGDLESAVTRLGVCDETGAMQIGVALREAVANAIFHGNLEVSSELLEDGGTRFHDLAAERRRLAPYAARRVHIDVDLAPGEVVFTIQDDGPGFDTTCLPDPTDLSNLEKPSGRGLMLIRTFMDEVDFNESGNRIRMVKRAESSA